MLLPLIARVRYGVNEIAALETVYVEVSKAVHAPAFSQLVSRLLSVVRVLQEAHNPDLIALYSVRRDTGFDYSIGRDERNGIYSMGNVLPALEQVPRLLFVSSGPEWGDDPIERAFALDAITAMLYDTIPKMRVDDRLNAITPSADPLAEIEAITNEIAQSGLCVDMLLRMALPESPLLVYYGIRILRVTQLIETTYLKRVVNWPLESHGAPVVELASLRTLSWVSTRWEMLEEQVLACELLLREFPESRGVLPLTVALEMVGIILRLKEFRA